MRNLWGPFGTRRRVEPPSFPASFGTSVSLTHLQCSNRKDMEPAWRTFYNTAIRWMIRRKGTKWIASVSTNICVPELMKCIPSLLQVNLSLLVGNRYFTGPCNSSWDYRMQSKSFSKAIWHSCAGTVAICCNKQKSLFVVKTNLQGATRAFGGPLETATLITGLQFCPLQKHSHSPSFPSSKHTTRCHN